ncbi:M20 family metallopeptidase [Actinoallomurus spadix]|uniref:M20 family metallopeptidase n=1 Tax=Actinoallomurus spadix TaxID=79912 RepID=A0ABP3FRV5_9ACTN|nr:M20 family metallopeptidase [Actinoallomurus spadix]MCO5985326.1 M20 family metallopeptidase [Actinoallomurus spadix]
MKILREAQALLGELTNLRHRLHAHPELGLDLPRTQAAVLEALDDLPLEITPGKNATSVTAVLRGHAPIAAGERTTVLLRADMDAVPVSEETGLPFRSRVEGAMHACGHDLHTAMLAGAARLLATRRDRLRGDVVLMFQPGEEGWEGARTMIEEGVLDASGRRADAAYGLHVFSTLPQRLFTRPGPMLAASSALLVTVHGAGGHASAPHLARDPVPATAEMISALQTMVTRRFDAFDPVVLTVGMVHAGTRRNVIPATATFEATIRTFGDSVADRVGEEALRLLQGIADAHGVRVDARFVRERPATVNDAAETAFAERTIRDVFGADLHEPLPRPFTGAEDFSRVLAEVPGSFVALGALPAGADPRDAAYNHSGHAVFDDAVLPLGAALYAELALRRTAVRPSGLPETPGEVQ